MCRGTRPHWRTHLPFVVLVAGYLGFRLYTLGVVTTAEEGHTIGERLGGAWSLFGQLVAPPHGSGPVNPGLWVALGVGLIICGGLYSVRGAGKKNSRVA